MLKPEFSGQFKRDYKLAVKRGCDPKKLETVITMLCAEQPLPAEFRDHALTNSRNYKGMRECHIQPDWLLVYRIRHEILVLQLIRTGTASFFSIAFIFKIVVIVLLRISGRLHQDIFSFGRASICVDFTACFISMC